jgi:hypothetical protein
MTADQVKVKRWMRIHESEYMDECNELDCTRLAEDAAQEFDLYEGDNCDIPEWVFELSAGLSN